MEPPDIKNVDLVLGRERKYRCEHCGLDYTMQKDLKIHLLNIHGLNSYTCSLCSELFYAEEALEDHKKSIHGGQTRHHCNLCSRSYKSVVQLEYHMDYKHKIEDAKYCPECGQQFYNSFALKRHLQLLHKPHHKYHDCHKCKRSFKRPHVLKQHVLFDHWKNGKKHALEYIKNHDIIKGLTDDAHKCKPCKLMFDSSIDLIYHLKNDHRKKVGKFACCQCEAVYPLRSSLAVHMRYDHKLLGHTCKKCPPTKNPGKHRPFKTKVKAKKEVLPRVYADRAYNEIKKQAPWVSKYIREKVPADLSLKNVKDDELSNLRHNIKTVFNILSTVPTSRLKASVNSQPVHKGPTKVVLGQNVDILDVMFPRAKSSSVSGQMENDNLIKTPLKSSDKPNIDSVNIDLMRSNMNQLLISEIYTSDSLGISKERKDVAKSRKRKIYDDVDVDKSEDTGKIPRDEKQDNAKKNKTNRKQDHLQVSRSQNLNRKAKASKKLGKLKKRGQMYLSMPAFVNQESENSYSTHATKTGTLRVKDFTIQYFPKAESKLSDQKQQSNFRKEKADDHTHEKVPNPSLENFSQTEIAQDAHKSLKKSMTIVVSNENEDTKNITKTSDVAKMSKAIDKLSPVATSKENLKEKKQYDPKMDSNSSDQKQRYSSRKEKTDNRFHENVPNTNHEKSSQTIKVPDTHKSSQISEKYRTSVVSNENKDTESPRKMVKCTPEKTMAIGKISAATKLNEHLQEKKRYFPKVDNKSSHQIQLSSSLREKTNDSVRGRVLKPGYEKSLQTEKIGDSRRSSKISEISKTRFVSEENKEVDNPRKTGKSTTKNTLKTSEDTKIAKAVDKMLPVARDNMEKKKSNDNSSKKEKLKATDNGNLLLRDEHNHPNSNETNSSEKKKGHSRKKYFKNVEKKCNNNLIKSHDKTKTKTTNDDNHNNKPLEPKSSKEISPTSPTSKSELKTNNIIENANSSRLKTIPFSQKQETPQKTNDTKKKLVSPKDLQYSYIVKSSHTSLNNVHHETNETPNQTQQSPKNDEIKSNNKNMSKNAKEIETASSVSNEKTRPDKISKCDENTTVMSMRTCEKIKYTLKDTNINKALRHENEKCKEDKDILKTTNAEKSSQAEHNGDNVSNINIIPEKLESKMLKELAAKKINTCEEQLLKPKDLRNIIHSSNNNKNIVEKPISNVHENYRSLGSSSLESRAHGSSCEKSEEKMEKNISANSRPLTSQFFTDGNKRFSKPTFKAGALPYLITRTQPKDVEYNPSIVLNDGRSKILAADKPVPAQMTSTDLDDTLSLFEISADLPILTGLSSVLEDTKNCPKAEHSSNDKNITSTPSTNQNFNNHETQVLLNAAFDASAPMEDTFKKVIVEKIETEIVSPTQQDFLKFSPDKELTPSAMKIWKSPKVIKISATPKIKLSQTFRLPQNSPRKVSFKLVQKLNSNNNETVKMFARNFTPLLDEKTSDTIQSLHADVTKTSNKEDGYSTESETMVIKEHENTNTKESSYIALHENLSIFPKMTSNIDETSTKILEKMKIEEQSSILDIGPTKEKMLKISSPNRTCQNKLQIKVEKYKRNISTRKSIHAKKSTLKTGNMDFQVPEDVLLSSLEKKAIIDTLLAKAKPILEKKFKENQSVKPIPAQVGQVVKPMQKNNDENVQTVFPDDSGTIDLIDITTSTNLQHSVGENVPTARNSPTFSNISLCDTQNLTDTLNIDETFENISKSDKVYAQTTPIIVKKIDLPSVNSSLKSSKPSKTSQLIIVSKDALSKNIFFQNTQLKKIPTKTPFVVPKDIILKSPLIPLTNKQAGNNCEKLNPIKVKMIPISTNKNSEILVGNTIPSEFKVKEHTGRQTINSDNDVEDSIPSYVVTSKNKIEIEESDLTSIKIVSQTLDHILSKPNTEENSKKSTDAEENEAEELTLKVDTDFCQTDYGKNNECFEIANYVDIETTNSPNINNSKTPVIGLNCKSCVFSCHDEISLLNHLTEFHANDESVSSYICTPCDKEFRSQDEYDTHIENDHSIECTKCGNHFDNDDFDNHKCIRNEDQNEKVETSFAVVNMTPEQSKNPSIMIMKQDHALEHLKLVRKDAIKPKKHVRFNNKINQMFTRKPDKIKETYCDICHIKFTTSLLLYNHNRTHHKDTHIFKCEECRTEFMRYENLKRHKCKPQTSFWCTKCNIMFTKREEAVEHKRAKHNLGSLKCDYCYKYFKSNNNLVKHLSVKHANHLDYVVQLPNMRKYSRSDGTIYDDLEIIKQASKTSPQKQVYNSINKIQTDISKCKDTPTQKVEPHKPMNSPNKSMFLPQKSMFSPQKSMFSPPKSMYKCPTCLEPFPDKPTVFAHMSATHGVEDSTSPSKNEGSIANSRKLCQIITETNVPKVAEDVKSREKNLKCNKCCETFSSSSLLVKHVHQYHRAKIAKKVYRCHRCNSIFTLYLKLKWHMKIKHSIKIKTRNIKNNNKSKTGPEMEGNMRKCEECGAFLPSNDSLQRHMQWEHMKVHKCGHCGEVLESAEEFLRHLISGHANDKIKEVMPESSFKWKTQLANKHERQGE